MLNSPIPQTIINRSVCFPSQFYFEILAKFCVGNQCYDGFLYEQQKYPCLFDQKAKNSKDVATATNFLQYHIIPGKAFTYLELHDIAISSNYMSSTALNGKKLYITGAGTKINGYSTINYPDIGALETQTIHGISSLLAPPGLVVTNSFLLHLIKQVFISFFLFFLSCFLTNYNGAIYQYLPFKSFVLFSHPLIFQQLYNMLMVIFNDLLWSSMQQLLNGTTNSTYHNLGLVSTLTKRKKKKFKIF